MGEPWPNLYTLIQIDISKTAFMSSAAAQCRGSAGVRSVVERGGSGKDGGGSE
jgi:hypothetical protein